MAAPEKTPSNEDSVIIEDAAKGKLNYGGLLFEAFKEVIHNAACANYNDKGDRDKFCCAVKGIYSILGDNTEKNAMYDAGVKKIKEESPTHEIDNPDAYYKWYRLLVMVVQAGNLLPAEDVTILDAIEDDETDLII